MLEFIGRLHPLLVHLPIGILLLAVLLYLLSHKERFASFQTSVVITVFIGGVSALLSCITGYILSLHNADEGVLVTRHQNLALLTTGLSIAWFYALATDKAKWMQHTAALLTVTALSFTGHLGGTLTHGEGYLFAKEEDIQTPSATPQPVKDVKEAMLYADLVQPLLQEKCVSCHGAKKQKGRLRLDAAEFIQKGGEDGMVVIAGQADGSELIRRINLPIAAKAHMPPRDKKQLTTEEIALLHFWVQSGLTFDQRVRDLIPKDPTADFVRAISDSTARISSPEPIIELPEKEVPPADPQALEALRRKGAVVLPVDRSSSYLQLNFVAADSLIDQDMPLLLSIKEQLVWLDLGGKPLGDAALRSIGQCTQLRKLNLRDTKVTDKGMRSISGLSELTYLNLSGTQVTAAGMKALSRLRRLRSLYLHRSGVTSSNWASIQSLFPTTVLDTGGYSLPVLEGDTTFLK